MVLRLLVKFGFLSHAGFARASPCIAWNERFPFVHRVVLRN